MFIHFRLENNSERNALKSSLASVKIRRKKRHRLRKTLLVLDYVVECCGCFFIFSTFFIAKTVFMKDLDEQRFIKSYVRLGYMYNLKFEYKLPYIH